MDQPLAQQLVDGRLANPSMSMAPSRKNGSKPRQLPGAGRI